MGWGDVFTSNKFVFDCFLCYKKGIYLIQWDVPTSYVQPIHTTDLSLPDKRIRI